MSEYYPGKGCKCAAHGQCECGCDVDWRSRREVELEEENKKLKIELKKMMQGFEPDTLREDKERMRIPEEEIINLGFTRFESHYESVDDIVLEDINDDGSVDLKCILMAYESMGELIGQKKVKQHVINMLDEHGY